eukprot:GHUV01044796.1.p1 GENE.GHUV01044796.1~~GHUV01044796.1.p1  ORF type:complete len:181 (+),score=31.50 GHUV01044796.1:29-544(+)
MDQGFGDVGVDQEPDAGRTQADNRAADPDFGVSKEEMRAADDAAAEQPTADVPLKEDLADLKAGPAEDVNTTDRDGAPVGIVDTSRCDLNQGTYWCTMSCCLLVLGVAEGYCECSAVSQIISRQLHVPFRYSCATQSLAFVLNHWITMFPRARCNIAIWQFFVRTRPHTEQ